MHYSQIFRQKFSLEIQENLYFVRKSRAKERKKERQQTSKYLATKEVSQNIPQGSYALTLTSKLTQKKSYSSNQITKREPKSDNRLSKFAWHGLSPMFLAIMLLHYIKVFQKRKKKNHKDFFSLSNYATFQCGRNKDFFFKLKKLNTFAHENIEKTRAQKQHTSV